MVRTHQATLDEWDRFESGFTAGYVSWLAEHSNDDTDTADQVGDLRVPPGNRLEKLRDDRANTFSIRINNQWRICFRWTTAGPEDVEIVDYH